MGPGAWVTGRRDDKREQNRISSESGFLSVLAVAHLDRFVDGCMDVANDTGEREGRPAGNNGEAYETTVSPPSFDPLALNVDWKVLPRKLMYEILNIPYKKERLSSRLENIAEYDDYPDFAEFFWARQHGYAELGLEVFGLARQLRVHAGLPPEVTPDGEANREQQLMQRRDQVIAVRDAYYDSQSWPPISADPITKDAVN